MNWGSDTLESAAYLQPREGQAPCNKCELQVGVFLGCLLWAFQSRGLELFKGNS